MFAFCLKGKVPIDKPALMSSSTQHLATARLDVRVNIYVFGIIIKYPADPHTSGLLTSGLWNGNGK